MLSHSLLTVMQSIRIRLRYLTEIVAPQTAAPHQQQLKMTRVSAPFGLAYR
jgi:hypothetical protein